VRRLFRLLVPSLLLSLFCELTVGGLIVGGLMGLPEPLGASCAPAPAANTMTHSASVKREKLAGLRLIRCRS
jgi:hypothetical protein